MQLLLRDHIDRNTEKMRQEGGSAAVLILLSLFIFVDVISTGSIQHSLLDADECMIGYQYRSPPEIHSCRANVEVNKLECWVAIPPLLPDTRAEVLWYWRSLTAAQQGSNVAVLVNDNTPYEYLRALCDRGSCPPFINNLTVHVHRLMIDNFDATLQGDYLCQVVLINQTSGTIEEELPPSNCARLQEASPDQAEGCDVMGNLKPWRCADQDQQIAEACPQQLSRPVEIVSSSALTQHSSNIIFYQNSKNIIATTLATFKPTMIISPSSTDTITTSPTLGEPSNENEETLGYIYALSSALVFLLIIGIVITIFIILGIRCMKQRRLTNLQTRKEGRAPSYVIGTYNTKESGVEEGSSRSKSGLNRVSTLYSKPFWPSDQQQDMDVIKDHHYATIPAEQNDQTVYSYAYQHHMKSEVQLAQMKQEKNGKGIYQDLGTVDYIVMYSKPSPLLVNSERNITPPAHIDEMKYKELSTATLNPPSIYTNPINKT